MKIKKSLKNFLMPFLLGYLVKEFVSFVNARGFAEDHLLAKSLFFMIITLCSLAWLWCNDEMEDLREQMEEQQSMITDLQIKNRLKTLPKEDK